MPAPTNTSFGTATEITLPVSLSQDAHDSGTTYTLYYKFTAPETGVWSIWGFGGTPDEGYRPTVSLYDDPLGFSFVAGTNRPLLVPVTAGVTYYIEAEDLGDPTPATLTLSVERCQHGTHVPARSFIINDDTAGVPAALISATEDNHVLRYLHPFPTGEAADVLADGTALFSDPPRTI